MKTSIVLCIFAIIAFVLCSSESDILVYELPVPESYFDRVENYWTEERMQKAIPYEIKLRTNMNATVDAVMHTGYVPREDYNEMPYAAVGKIFFKEAGRDYVCSGSVTGNNAILTAAHCVSNGKGTFHTNWVFKPSYYEKNAPKGTWSAAKFVIFRQYHTQGYLGRDVAFGIVNKVNGKTVEEGVGAKLGFQKAERRATVSAIGYPVPRYGGEKMVMTRASIDRVNNQFRPASIGISSYMQGGCSGGPWVCEGNIACGLNSYGHQGQNDLYSPTFDDEVMRARQIALEQ